MKTIKSIILLGISAFILLSCEVALGKMLDLAGPIVEIVSPEPRKAVPSTFTLEGTAYDETGIDELLITASITVDKNVVQFDKQWRYKGKWEISLNKGATWSAYNASWLVKDKSVTWAVPIDMTVEGKTLDDGEYLFAVQAWDSGRMSDDNSYKTRVIIVDKYPPKVDIVNLVLYRGSKPWEYDPLKTLHDIADDSDARFDPSNIGKFSTQGFDVKWQVEDNHDVASVEFMFYKHDVTIDGDASTPLPDDYIYRYYVNLPDSVNSNGAEILSSIKPNGGFTVPALDGKTNALYDGELKTPIEEKTTVMIATMCYDAAGNANQEKIIGYFIYWPLADEPWIIYTDGMEKPEFYSEMVDQAHSLEDILKEEAFMIYPGRTIRANAYHNHGVTKINYSLYTFDEFTGEISAAPISGFGNMDIPNPPRPNGTFSTVFPWEFRPPARSGYFVVEAVATSIGGRVSPIYTALFRVQDISFPDFPEPVNPSASDPLFMHVDVDENTVTFYGIVRDATQVENLDMVWINPESAGFATQNQIRFFREPEFEGWQKIEELTQGQTSISLTNNSAYIQEDYLETQAILNSTHPTGIKHPNKIWRLAVKWKEEDQDTRQVYTFSITINLDDFNIGLGTGKQPLKSQVFLFKAKNPDNRTTIITYAPQGDESPPVIAIQDVTIGAVKYIPQEFAMIPRFLGGETITINGTWREDSALYLPIADYFSGNFKASINTIPLPNLTVSYNNPSVQSTTGTWTAVVEVEAKSASSPDTPPQGKIYNSNLNDSLVVAVETKDFGGNVSEAGGSWLVESDDLRLIRISSNNDGTFRAGQTVTIFLEFSKAVQLLYSGSAPTLTLNSSTGANATAIYKPNDSQSTRQEFVYTVGANHSATRLNVTGITSTPNTWNQINYPFTWARGAGETREEIRVTMNQGHTVNTPNPSGGPSVTSGRLYARQLPVNENASHADYQFTLAAGKNIRIDTAPPTVVSVENTISGTNPVHFSSGDIFIRVRFSEPVMIGSTVPQLQLRLHNNRTVTTSALPADIRVSGTDITFKYTILNGDTTGNDPIRVTGITGGAITDLAGTPYSASFTATDITNRFINTLAPDVPTVRLFSTQVSAANATDGNAVTNIVGTTTHYGTSSAAYTNRTLTNVYHQNLFIAVQSNNSSVSGANSFTGNNNLQENTGLEYSVVDSGTRNWVKVAPGNMNNSPFSGLLPGTYRLVARQINRAGIVSAVTPEITFTWDPGQLVTRIDSSTPNGTYSNNTTTKSINITVNFRKPLTFAAGDTRQITLNVTRGGNVGVNVTSTQTGSLDSLTFTYDIAANDNCADLDVTALNITARDATNGVLVSTANNHVALPDTANRLGTIKDIVISTGALTLASGVTAPTWASTTTSVNMRAADEWTGTISLRFNRAVSKGSGNITITQNTTGYRLPAVLTDAQSAKYKSARNFNTFYTRGTNGSAGGAVDTSTKWILRYDQATVVTPNNTGTAIQQLAYDFHLAETVTIPVSSEDITITGTGNDTLTINILGSNALSVLGAAYNITYDANIVQDSLGYRWPASAQQQYTNGTTPNNGGTIEINRPFVRIDKRINEDRITGNTDGNLSKPHLSASYSRVLTTTARLDCRTPNSIVRYTGAGTEYTATGVTGMGGWEMTNTTTTASNWVNNTSANDGTDNNNINTMPTQPTLAAATGGTVYDNFTGTGNATLIPIGTANEQGYIWRVSARSRDSSSGSINSDQYEEMAFRTVLTYQLDGMPSLNGTYGQNPKSGDQLWIRGGDAVSSSSVPGFPLTWDDDFAKLNAEARRAGVRLMEWKSPAPATTTFTTSAGPAANTNQYTAPAGTTIPASDSVLTARVGTTNYFLRVISNTNRTFRLYNTDNEDAFAATAVNGVASGTGNISVTFYSPPMVTTSEWKYVTWEINVRTWFDVVLGRSENMNTAQAVNNAWQYGPRQTAYQRGGWSAAKDNYTLYPGKHRWIRITNGNYANGSVNFSYLFNPRDNPTTVTLTQPSP